MRHSIHDGPLSEYFHVQHGESILYEPSAQKQRMHQARRQHGCVSRVTEAERPLQRCEKLEAEGTGTAIVRDRLHLVIVERVDEEGDRVRDPVEQGGKYLEERRKRSERVDTNA